MSVGVGVAAACRVRKASLSPLCSFLDALMTFFVEFSESYRRCNERAGNVFQVFDLSGFFSH